MVLYFFWKSIPLPCKFDVYDLNSNMVISVEEFMNATEGFTKMDRKTLFELVDRNGKIGFSAMKRFHLCSFMFLCIPLLFCNHDKYTRVFSCDMFIGVDEFKSVPQTIVSAGILDHCLRIKMFKGGCIDIGWGK